MGYNALIEDMYNLFAEACTEGVEEIPEAREWVSEYLEELISEEVKDLAHHYNIPSFEVIHPARLKAELTRRMVEEMLNEF